MAPDKSQCTMKLLGEACTEEIDCRVPGSLCSQEKRCACALGRYATRARDYCVWRKVYDACVVDEDCSFAMKQSHCVVDWCLCRVGTIPTTDEVNCVPHDDIQDILQTVIYFVAISLLVIINVMLVVLFYHYIKGKLGPDWYGNV